MGLVSCARGLSHTPSTDLGPCCDVVFLGFDYSFSLDLGITHHFLFFLNLSLIVRFICVCLSVSTFFALVAVGLLLLTMHLPHSNLFFLFL